MNGERKLKNSGKLISISGNATSKKVLKRLVVPTADGILILPLREILRFEAVRNYTAIILVGGKRIVIPRSLNYFVERLETEPGFIQVHRSFFVNLNLVNRYVRGKGGYLIMEPRSSVAVSAGFKDKLIKTLDALFC